MTARDFLPEERDWGSLVDAAQTCRGCDLYQRATQTVFGEGPPRAALMMIGEQPGDQEDIQGRPFVGPAGRLLFDSLEEAGIERDEVYVTNAVKHYKWTPRGKRRLHKKPDAREISACRPWLDAEVEAIGPHMILCLGATAAQAVLGRHFRLTKHFGQVQTSDLAPWTLATYHPSALLRAPDRSIRHEMRDQFHSDLHLASRELRRYRAGRA